MQQRGSALIGFSPAHIRAPRRIILSSKLTCLFFLAAALTFNSAAPLIAAEAVSTDLRLPRPGDHSLQILSPNLLELVLTLATLVAITLVFIFVQPTNYVFLGFLLLLILTGVVWRKRLRSVRRTLVTEMTEIGGDCG